MLSGSPFFALAIQAAQIKKRLSKLNDLIFFANLSNHNNRKFTIYRALIAHFSAIGLIIVTKL